MTSTPRWSRFLAEGLLIVASILLAFSIDAWWDGRQEDDQRRALLSGLATEFESVQDDLAEAVSRAEALERSTRTLLEAAGNQIELHQDSIRSLAGALVGGGRATLVTPRYDSAVRSGSIALLRSDSLLIALSTFDTYRSAHENLIDILIDTFYEGPLHDLRVELGSLSVLNPSGGQSPAPSRLVPPDLNPWIQRRAVIAVIEQVHVLRVNQLLLLQRLDDASALVSAELESSLSRH